MNSKRLSILAVGLVASIVLAACGGEPTSLDVTLKGLDTFKYEPTTITAQVGQEVNVTLDNVGVLEHSFVIDELGVTTENVAAGQQKVVSFTPQTAGTYTFYCHIPAHKEAGMVGTLTVNP